MPAHAEPLTQQAAQHYGPNGLTMIADTDDHEGDWCALHFVEDTVFNALRGRGMTGTFTGKTFIAGDTIFNGLGFTFIDLASGSVIAYNR